MQFCANTSLILTLNAYPPSDNLHGIVEISLTSTVKLSMDPQHYLDRIGHQGQVDVSLGCLSRLQLHHQTAVPFENLDNFTGRRKVLQEEALYHQVSEDMSPSLCTRESAGSIRVVV